MLRLVKSVEAACLRTNSRRQYGWRRLYSSQAKSHEPLNILFCSADEFSIYSLRALRELQLKRPEKIAGIDVVCRPDKYVGRGLKNVQQVPIKATANDLGLTLHQIDTFKGWKPPASINLVVAVSFGLLVPERILNGAKYGGLNVHPSLLPDLRGPAPIVHALLKRRTHTGVTLQTMHPTRFDHGVVLSQTPTPGIPIPYDCTSNELIHTLGPLGAELLCHGIENCLFVNPKDSRAGAPEPADLDHAPKLTPEDRHIHWNSWTADEILLRDKVLGRLWDMNSYVRCFESKHPKRVAFDGPWTIEEPTRIISTAFSEATPGQLVLMGGRGSKIPQLSFRTSDDRFVEPASITIDGEKKGAGMAAFVNHLTR